MFGIFGSKVSDPVCKMRINQEESKYFLEYKGKKYYFCSESCQKKFETDSDKYASYEKVNTDRCCH